MKNDSKISNWAYKLSVIASAAALIIIGGYRLLPGGPAMDMEMLSGHFFFSWLYMVLSPAAVSALLAIPSISLGILLLASLRRAALGRYAGIAGVVFFGVSLVFILTVPDIWMFGYGIPQTVLLISKDVPNLAISLRVWANSINSLKA